MHLDSLDGYEKATIKITEDLKEIETFYVTATDFSSFSSKISERTFSEAIKIVVEDFLSGPHYSEAAKINQHRIKEYAKINLDVQFILPHKHHAGSTEAISNGNTNTNSSSSIGVEIVSPDPTIAGCNL